MKNLNFIFNFLLFPFLVFLIISSSSIQAAEYTCDGENVTNIHTATSDGYQSYTTGEDIDEQSRYFKFRTQIDGEITIHQTNNKPVNGYWNHELTVGTDCQDRDIYNGPNTRDDSTTFNVTANTWYYVRVQERNNRNVLNFDITFDFTADTPLPPNICTGTRGLNGNYYNDSPRYNSFIPPIILSRIDSDIDFAWGSGGPGGGIGTDNFSTEWTGTIYFPESADYTFSLAHDDQMTLIIDGNQLYNSTSWTGGSNNFEPASPVNFAAGTYPITIRFSEGGGGAYARLAWRNNASISSETIVPNINFCAIVSSAPPTISNKPIPGQTATVGTTFTLDIDATEPDGDTITYTATGLPPGLNIDTNSGLISGIPTTAGTYTVTATATDKDGSDNASFDIVVSAPPTISNKPIPGQTATVGTTFTLDIDATEPDGDTITYTATGLPPGLNIDTNSGLISGISTAAGTYTVTATATDKDGSDNASFDIVVIELLGPVDPNFVQCGLFPSALNTWSDIVSGNGDTVIDADTVYADNRIGKGDIECTVNGTAQDCLVEEMPGDPITLPTFITSPISDSYTANGTETNTSYGDVTVNDGSTIIFDPAGTYDNGGSPVMLINSINIGTGATVTFTEGDYWIGSWTSAASINIRTNGKVRLFINNNLDLTQNHIDFNYDGGTGIPGDMFIFVYGNFDFASDGGGDIQNMTAYVYVDGVYTANHNTANSAFRGSVTSVGDINLNNNQQYTYDDSGLLDGWGACCVAVGFERTGYEVREDINLLGNQEFVETRIILAQAVSYDVTVQYSTEDGTARVIDGDYPQRTNQTVTIYAGDTNVSLPIGIYNDAPIELDENFFVQLSNPLPTPDICLNDNNRTEITILAQEDSPICFEDDFSNGLDEKWRVLESRGGYIPAIADVNGDARLRLTDKSRNLSTVITKDYEFETTQNLIIVEFDYYAYGGCDNNWGGIGAYGADGIVNTLFDSSVGSEPVAGGSGGSMGYAQYVNNTSGFEGGWLGLGIDEYGNFSNPTEERIGGPGFRTNAIAIRGDGSGMTGYEFLEGAQNITPPVASLRSDHLNDYYSGRYKMTVDARDPNHLYVRLERSLTGSDGDYNIIINQFDAKDPQYNQGITPAKVRYAISSGTGGGCNNHELSWIRLKGNCAVYGPPSVTGPFDAWDVSRDNTAIPPTDRNISTKIANKDFQLSLGSMNSTNDQYEVKPGLGGNVEVAVYQNNSLDQISNTVYFDARNISHVPSTTFSIVGAGAYKDAVVGFKICATNDHNATTGENAYELWPTASCSGPTVACDAPTFGTPSWHLCYSSDNFAIRPDTFNIDLRGTGTFKAGQPYPIDFRALDGAQTPGNTSRYNESENGSFEVVSSLSPDPGGCMNPSIDRNSSIKFQNGLHNGDYNQTYLNTVGDFNLTLHEVIGSEFAIVDEDDTDDVDRLIREDTVNPLHIIPDRFGMVTTLSNANTVDNFTYIGIIDSTQNTMAATLNINLEALIADGSRAENYESDCYADDTVLNTDYNLSEITPVNTLANLHYYDRNNTAVPAEADVPLPITTPANDNFNISFANTLFPSNAAGSADINLALNFDRRRNQAVNPFTLTINDVNLTETDNELSTQNVVSQNARYFYARAKASKDLYDDVTASSINTPISVLVYCDLWAGCTALGVDTALGNIDESYWWLSTNHNEALGDGNITLLSPPNILDSEGTGAPTVDTDVTVTANGQDSTITVNSGATTLPMTVGINLDTGTTNTNPWLIYNPDHPTADPTIPFYKVRFINISGWSGIGNTGYVLDVNASSKKTKRLNW